MNPDNKEEEEVTHVVIVQGFLYYNSPIKLHAHSSWGCFRDLFYCKCHWDLKSGFVTAKI